MQQLQVPVNNNNNNNNKAQLRLTLADFSSNLSEAKTWYRKFTLLVSKYEWHNAKKCLQLSFHPSDSVGVWFSSIYTGDWAKLKAAFEKQFLNTEPTLVTDSKLQSGVFQPHIKTIDEYYSSSLSLGATLGHASEQLATNFMNGLPESIKDFVIGTDNHTMENYLSRARLYLARRPSGAKAVRFENQFPTTEVAAGADIVNAIAQGFKQLKLHMPGAVPEHVAKTEPNTSAVTHHTEGVVIIGEPHRAQGGLNSVRQL